MISLTDYALFTTLGRELGATWYDSTTPETCVRGTFSLGDKAFRDYEKRFGELRLPLYSVMWTDMARDDLRFNHPAARHGVHVSNLANLLEGFKVKTYPITLTYEVNIWTTKVYELLDAIRTIHFFATNVGGNGAIVDFEDISEDLKAGTEGEVLQALQGFSFDLVVGADVSMEKSDPSSEMGTYYKSTLTILANTWWAQGLKLPLVRKIISSIYSDEIDATDVLLGQTTRQISPS